MKLGTMVILDDDFVDEGIRKVKKYGLKSCQICCWDMARYTDENVEKIKKTTAETGIEISTVWCGWEFPSTWDFIDGYRTIGLVPREFRKHRVQNLKQGSDFAKKLGVKQIATHMGFLSENCNTDEYEQLVLAIREVAEYAKSNGQYLLFETGQETPITLMRTIECVGTGNLGINLDPANLILYGKGNPCDAVEIFGKYIMDIHAKDGNYPTDFMKLGEEKRLGDGHVNFPLFIRKLKEVGYNGSVTIEREIGGEEQVKDILYAKDYLEALINEKA